MYSSEVSKYHNLDIIERLIYIENLVESFPDIKDLPKLIESLEEVKKALPNLLKKSDNAEITGFWTFIPEKEETRPGIKHSDGSVSKFLIDGEGGKFPLDGEYNLTGQWTFNTHRPKYGSSNLLIEGEGFDPKGNYEEITGKWRFKTATGNSVIFDKKPLFHKSDKEGNLEFLVKGDEGTFDSEGDYTITGAWNYGPKKDNRFCFLFKLPLYKPDTSYTGDYFLAAGELGPEDDHSWNIKGKWTFSDSDSVRPGIGKGSNFKKFLVEGEGGGGSGFDPSLDNTIYGSWTFNPKNPKKPIVFFGKKPVFRISVTEFDEPTEFITQNDLNTEITKINNKITDIVNKLPDKTQTTTIDGAWVFDSDTPIVFKVPPVVKNDAQNEEGSPLITQKVFNNRLNEIINTIADKGSAATISGKWTFTGERPGYNSTDGFKEFLIKGEGGGGGGDFDPSKSYNITNTWYYSNIPYLRVKKPETQTEEYIDYSFLTTNSIPVIESKWKFNEYPEVKVGEEGEPRYKPVLTETGIWVYVAILGGLISGGIITFGATDLILAYRKKKIAAVETNRDLLPYILSVDGTYTKFSSFKNDEREENWTGACILEGGYYYDPVYQIKRWPVAIDTYSSRDRELTTDPYNYYYFLNIGATKKHNEGQLLVNRHLTPFEYCVLSNGKKKEYLHRIIIGDESKADTVFPTEASEWAYGLCINYYKLTEDLENRNYFDSMLVIQGSKGGFTSKEGQESFSTLYMTALECARTTYNYRKLDQLNFASINSQDITLAKFKTEKNKGDDSLYDVGVLFEGFKTKINPEKLYLSAYHSKASQIFSVPDLNIGNYEFKYITTQDPGEKPIHIYTTCKKKALEASYADSKKFNEEQLTNKSTFNSTFGYFDRTSWITQHVNFKAHSFSITDTSRLESLKPQEPFYTDFTIENVISSLNINPTDATRKTTCIDYLSNFEFTEIPEKDHLIIPHVKKYTTRLSRLIPPNTPYSSLMKFSGMALDFYDEFENEESDLTITLGKFEGSGPGEQNSSLWQGKTRSFFRKLSNDEKVKTKTFSDIRFEGCFDNLPYVERIDHNPTTGIISFAVIPNPCCVPSLDPKAFTSGHVIYASTYDTNVCDPSKPTTVEITADVVKIPMRTGIGNYSAEGLKDIANIPENIASVGFLKYVLDPIKTDIEAVRSLSQYSAALSSIGAAGTAVMAATKLIPGVEGAGTVGAIASSFSMPKPPDAPGDGSFMEDFSEFEIENLELKKSFMSNSIGSQITSASLSHGDSFLEASTGSWIGDISTIVEANKTKYKINTEKWAYACTYGNPPGLDMFPNNVYTFAVNSNIYFGNKAVGRRGHDETNKFKCYSQTEFYVNEKTPFTVYSNESGTDLSVLSVTPGYCAVYGTIKTTGLLRMEGSNGLAWNHDNSLRASMLHTMDVGTLTIKSEGPENYQSTIVLSGKKREGTSGGELSLNTTGKLSLMASEGIELYKTITPRTREVIKSVSTPTETTPETVNKLIFNQYSTTFVSNCEQRNTSADITLFGTSGDVVISSSGEIRLNKQPVITPDGKNKTILATEDYVNNNSIVKIDGKTKESINEKVVLIRDTMNDGTTQYFLAVKDETGHLHLLNDPKYMSEFITRAQIN